MKLERIATLLTEAEETKIHIPDELPLVRAGVEKAFGEQSVARFDQRLEEFRQYAETGELIKAEWNRLKEINRYLEQAFKTTVVEKMLDASHSGNQPEWFDDMYYGAAPSLHSAPGKLKKWQKIQKKHPDDPIVKEAIAFLEQMVPLSDAHKKLKSMIVAKKGAQVKKEKEVAETKAKQLSHTDVQKIRKVLIELTDELRSSVLQSNINYFNGLVQNWAQQYNPRDKKTQNYHYNARNPYARDIVHKAQEQNHSFQDPEKLKADYSQEMHKAAKEVTDTVLGQFVEKNTTKLAQILSDKGDLKQVDLKQATASRGVVEGWMTLTFNSGASFNVNNKVVWSYSKMGRPFARFPTTFHKVKLSDGSYLSMPSEKKMKDSFK